jgi:Uma2 family endonuclease
VILSSEDEVQPDGILLILPGFGGKSQFAAKRSSKSRTPVQYVKGPPELVAEIADTSRRIDLGKKKNRYACCGITEYIVMSVRPKRLYWFNLQTGHELKADSDGIFRSEVFPGLWIHAKALLDHDGLQSMKTLEQGLASDEHAQFVAKLAAARRD